MGYAGSPAAKRLTVGATHWVARRKKTDAVGATHWVARNCLRGIISLILMGMPAIEMAR